MRGEVIELLKRTRQEKGFSLKDVEAGTHAPMYYLRILEGEGDPRVLSDALYIIPFLRAYADFLGLDSAAVVAQFVAAMQKDDVLHGPSQAKLGRLFFRAGVVLLILAGLAVSSFFRVTGEHG